MGTRIVLATFGSLGDLHPFLSIALGLRARGHDPVLATHESYRNRVETLGIGFAPLRPNYDPAEHQQSNRDMMRAWRGTEFILREGLFPYLRDTYEDLERASAGASLIVAHTIVFPAPMLSERTGIRWASVSLAPIALMSPTDPPHVAPVPWVNKVWSFGPRVNRALIGLIRKQTDSWCGPIRQLRSELGLPPGKHPLFEGMHSPALTLALFSSILGEPQPDWPASVQQTGFCFLDDARDMPEQLHHFLDDGPPPVIFTLGSAAVLTAGDFFLESARAVAQTGCRAVFICGQESRIPANSNLFITPYAPYSQVFRRAAVVVHQGGVGTTAQCLRAGRPALIVPFAHDQPDNANRIVRAGAGQSIPQSQYRAKRAAGMIAELLGNPAYRANAEALAQRVALEDGVDSACRAILKAASR